ncbi:MAG: type I restriction endonuclease, partial [Candidatus Eremiobacterota bacterium]
MDFIDKIRNHQLHARGQVELIEKGKTKGDIPIEEDTKLALIQPFINNVFGYNISDLNEVKTEFLIDEKGLKTDYAILKEGKPIILIECKKYNDILDKKYITKLKIYYNNIDGAKFAILTNGIQYLFYTDLERENILDGTPFFEFNLFNTTDSDIKILSHFTKSADLNNARQIAEELKKRKDLRKKVEELLEDPPKDFVKFMAKQVGVSFVGESVVKEYSSLIKDVINEYISDKTNKNLNPTNIELEGYYIIKTLLKDIACSGKISFKKTDNSIIILYKDSKERTICSLYLNDIIKYIGLFQKDDETKIIINTIDDIYKYTDQIISKIKPPGPKSFVFDGEEYKVRFWKEMLPKVCAIMASRHKDRFEDILNLRGTKNPYFSKNDKDLTSPELIEGTDIYAESWFSKNGLMKQSKRVISLF